MLTIALNRMSRINPPATETGARYLRASFFSRYTVDGGHASTRSSRRWRSTSRARSLAVVFLVFTLRAFLYKPFVSQVRSMRKMQEFQPEIAKLRKKYANDKQKQAAEMQRLQKEHGVNPVAGCLPILIQVHFNAGLAYWINRRLGVA